MCFRSGEIRILDSGGSAEPLFRSTTRIDNCDVVVRVYAEAGNVIETHEHAGDFKEW